MTNLSPSNSLDLDFQTLLFQIKAGANTQFGLSVGRQVSNLTAQSEPPSHEMRFSFVVSLAVAAVLLFSGILHAIQPYLFMHTVASYQIFPKWAVGLLALWIPYFQIVLGLCFGLGIARRTTNGIAALLFAAFALAQLSVLARGLDIDCGCFGFVSSKVTVRTVGFSAVLFMACAAMSLSASDRRLQSRVIAS